MKQAPYRLQLYDNGALISDTAVDPKSDFLKRISAWLLMHQDGWESTWIDYVPHRVVRGAGFDINFGDHATVLNYRIDGKLGKWGQYRLKLTEADRLEIPKP